MSRSRPTLRWLSEATINQNLIGGLAVAGVGAIFLCASLDLGFGTARRMGPGFLPTLTSVVVIVLGLIISVTGHLERENMRAPDWRSAAFVLAGILAFALVVQDSGLLPAVALCVFISAFANEGQSILGATATGIVAAIGTWVIFILLLGLPVAAIGFGQ